MGFRRYRLDGFEATAFTLNERTWRTLDGLKSLEGRSPSSSWTVGDIVPSARGTRLRWRKHPLGMLSGASSPAHFWKRPAYVWDYPPARWVTARSAISTSALGAS